MDSIEDTLHLGNDPEGIFNPDSITFMPDIWGWVCMNFGISSVLDIGCGIGTNLAWFDEYGFDVLGIEGHPNAIAGSLLPGKIIQHDFTKGPWVPERQFDLCICTEFAEHVEAEFEENWLLAVDKCNYVLLAAAPPGQGGYHHVNEQPDSYWVKRFESRGMIQDEEITAKLRATCNRKPAHYGRNVIMFLRQKECVNLPDNALGRAIPQSAHYQFMSRRDAEILITQNKKLKGKIDNLYASLSWKITLPFRWLLGLFR